MSNSVQENRTDPLTCPLIEEEQYLSDMKETAWPFLMKHRKEVLLQRGEGESLFCVCCAPETAPRGLILVSHGFTETAEKYREVSYYLLQNGYAVIIMEHCGHGRSYDLRKEGRPGKGTVSEPHRNGAHTSGITEPSEITEPHARDRIFVDCWQRYRDDLLLTAHHARALFGAEYEKLPLLLYAHSMGGGIAAAAAAAEPSLFAGVILSSPMIRPTSGGLPWGLTKFICAFFCGVGKGTAYAPGQGSYNLKERFEESAACSEPRFLYYQEIRRTHAYCQMGGATYGWMNAAVQLSDWLLKDGWKTITCPILVFQADNDSFVMNAQQDEFVQKLQEHGRPAHLIHMPGTKHEIFNAHNDVLEIYWKEILAFFQECTDESRPAF